MGACTCSAHAPQVTCVFAEGSNIAVRNAARLPAIDGEESVQSSFDSVDILLGSFPIYALQLQVDIRAGRHVWNRTLHKPAAWLHTVGHILSQARTYTATLR